MSIEKMSMKRLWGSFNAPAIHSISKSIMGFGSFAGDYLDGTFNRLALNRRE